jgi:acyl dehydratase
MTHKTYFEDFLVGAKSDLGEHTFVADEMIAFAEKFDPQPVHVDPQAAAKTVYGGLIASGLYTCSVMMGMLTKQILIGSSAMGSTGIDEIRWLKPVRPGDTMKVSVEIEGARLSHSRFDRGVIVMRWDGVNQHGDAVVYVRAKLMFGRRPPTAGTHTD